MNWDEYNKLFHKLELNLVAFKPLMDCDQEVLKLVNAAIEAEREACAALCFQMWNDSLDRRKLNHPDAEDCAAAIRARGQ
jgi:hypothetical protein